MMEVKRIEDFNLADCCRNLGITRQDVENRKHNLPALLGNINTEGERDELVKERLKYLIETDTRAFQQCTTIAACEKYLKNWPDGLWRQEAKEKIFYLKCKDDSKSIATSISNCEQYLKKYPNGCYVTEVRSILAKLVRERMIRRIIVGIAILVVCIIVCLCNLKTASYISLNETEYEIHKKGSKVSLSYSTDATVENIDVDESVSWIDVEKDKNGKLIVTVDTNYGDKRTATLAVKAYSSFFGGQYKYISEKVSISQASGLPSYLNVSSDEIKLNKFGTSSDIEVTTDGCGVDIDTDADWISISSIVNNDPETISVRVQIQGEVNNGSSKSGYVTVRSGEMVRRVSVYQESGLATYFRVERTSLNMVEEGTNSGECYPIDVYTDGASWSVKSAPSWLNAYADMSDKRLEVTLERNTGYVNQGTIVLVSNNGDEREIEVKQDGEPSKFSASSSTITFDTPSDYMYVAINNNSNKYLTVEESEDWLSASVSDKNKIRISCTSNSGSPRKGTVYVRCGKQSLSITVKQRGWIPCYSCGGQGYHICGYSALWMGTYHYINNFVIHPYTGNGYYVQEPCPYCKGRGRIECSNCGGAGRIKSS